MKTAIIMFMLSGLAHAELPLNQRYLMYNGNGATYDYTSSTESLGVPTNSMNSLVTNSRTGTPSAQTINMPSGSYLVVPNYTTGRVIAVIQTSRAK